MTDTIVVTGASRGLGAHCATRLHEAGYKVIGLGRKPTKDLPYVTRIVDVADPASVKAGVDDLRRDESVYALINAAGIASMNLVLTTPPETVKRIIDTNLLGTIYC